MRFELYDIVKIKDLEGKLAQIVDMVRLKEDRVYILRPLAEDEHPLYFRKKEEIVLAKRSEFEEFL